MNCKRCFHRIKIFGQKQFDAAKLRPGIRRSRTERERAVLIVNDYFGVASYCLLAGAWYLLVFVELRTWANRRGVKK